MNNIFATISSNAKGFFESFFHKKVSNYSDASSCSLNDLPSDIIWVLFNKNLVKHALEGTDFPSLSLVSKEMNQKMKPIYSKISQVSQPVFETPENTWSLIYDLKVGLAVSGLIEGSTTSQRQGIVYDMRANTTNNLTSQTFEIRHFTFSPTGDKIIGMTKRGEYGLSVWNRDGKKFSSGILKTPEDYINTIHYAKNHGVISGSDSSVYFHDRNSKEPSVLLKDIHPRKLKYDDKHDLLVAFSDTKIILAYSPFTAKDAEKIELECSYSGAGAYSETDGVLAYLNKDKRLVIFDVVNKKKLLTYEFENPEESGEFCYIHEPSSHVFLVSKKTVDNWTQTFMYVLKMEDSKVEYLNRFPLLVDKENKISTLANSMLFLPNASVCVTASYGAVDFWNIQTGEKTKSIPIEKSWLRDLQLDPMTQEIYVTAENHSNGIYKLYRIAFEKA